LAGAIVGAALFALVPQASADHHLMSIREVFPGGGANSSYVELQMYSPGQQFLGSHTITAYGPTGTPIVTHTFPGPNGGGAIGSGQNQSTILLADSSFSAAFPSGPTPDATNAGLDIPAGGGAVCFEIIDCVDWGNFSGSVSPSPGPPASVGGVTAGKALRRSISGGSCNGQLEAADDTNNSANDFSEQDPNPRSSGSTILETSCTVVTGPTVTITPASKPPNPTNVNSASFSFTTDKPPTSIECKLDTEASFSSCTSPKAYSGIPDGQRTFQVKATDGDGTGPTASHTWNVDTAAPTASITEKPVNPSPGKSVSFKYSSNETGSKFECRLVPLEASFADCTTQPKKFSNLTNGSYTFEVKAIDAATNKQPAATTYVWEVDNSLVDEDPPETTIVTKPDDPSSSASATFTYESDEPGSSYACKLDVAAFAACPPTGITYNGLTNGQHTFQVRATDASNNSDETPAGYSFSVVLPVLLPPIVTPPTEQPPPAVTPDTRITSKPKAKGKDRTPTVKFSSTVGGATFECRLDGKAFTPCRSPLTTKTLSLGKHTLKVRAVLSGLKDPSPAACSFKIVKAKK
jgi:hypothetical protein